MWTVMVAMIALLSAGVAVAAGGDGKTSRMESPPRKVVVASAMGGVKGYLDARLKGIEALVAEAEKKANATYGTGVDLVAFTEWAIGTGKGKTAAEQSVRLEGKVADRLGDIARKHKTNLVSGIMLTEGKPGAETYANAAVMIGRDGKLIGIYRKAHPVVMASGALENGVKAGAEAPVFDCDFGKVGVQICWDVMFEEGWAALGQKGAELVVMPSASPALVRPGMWAARYRYYVVNSTPRDNLTLFSPAGLIVAQETRGNLLVQQIDLAYAVLAWSEKLRDGESFKEKYGAAAGFKYSSREDVGVFWSNDPKKTIGTMVKELELKELDREEVLVKELEAMRGKVK